MNLKQETFSVCLSTISKKIESLETSLRDLSEGAANEGKSSAGDKHETARAMAQLEQEKLGKQLLDAQAQKAVLEKNNGTLLKTNRGYIFICIALGRIIAGGETVMAISPQSPLGALFGGKKTGESISFNSIDYRIDEVVS